MSGDWREGDETTLDSLVVLVAESLGYSCTRLPGDVMELEGRGRLHIGLRDLWQLARMMPRDDWPAVVSDHVTTIVTAVEEPLDLAEFAPVRHLLRARIYPWTADHGPLAARPFAPGLIEVAVIDTPTTVRMLTRAEAEAWPVPPEELFALGRANVRADGPLQRVERRVGECTVTELSGWTFYAATHVFWLEEYLTLGPLGALVALPNRGLVLAAPLRLSDGGYGRHVRHGEETVALVAARLHERAAAGYREGPGSLSPELFWWRQGGLTPLEARADGRGLVLPEGLLVAVAGERTSRD